MGRDVTSLGSVAVLVLATLAVVGFLLLDRRYAAMLFVLAAVVSGLVLSSLLKACFARPRPEVVPHLAQVYSSSFPSGHSMMSAIVYLTLGTLLARMSARRPLKVYFLAVALILTALVGCSRVYLGVHYPTDVLAGWTAGLVWANLCWLVARRLQRRARDRETSLRDTMGTRRAHIILWTVVSTVLIEAFTIYLRFGRGVGAVEFDKTAPLLLQMHLCS